MFRTLIYPSSGACDYSVELPHWSYYSWFDVCWSYILYINIAGWSNCASACNTDTTPTQPHRNSNTHRTKNNTINLVIQQNSRKLLMMDILMSETCWAHKKWNKITSDIKLVFYSSTIKLTFHQIFRFVLYRLVTNVTKLTVWMLTIVAEMWKRMLHKVVLRNVLQTLLLQNLIRIEKRENFN